jgi:hypothetical protein
MTTARAFFLADCDDQEAIHFQQFSRGSPCWRDAADALAVPCKMIAPALAAWMKERDLGARGGIGCTESSRLSQGTRNAGQRQVSEFRCAATDHGMNMIDMKSGFLTRLRQTAIFTSVASAPHDFSPQPAGNIHVTLRRGLRVRSLSRERNSANSTNPSASRRSPAESGFPKSCWSSNVLRRR